MGNTQIYKFCNNCTGEGSNDQKSIEQVYLENGKMVKQEDESGQNKYKAFNISSTINDKSEKGDLGTAKSFKNPIVFSEANSVSGVNKVNLGEGNYYEGPLVNGKYSGEGNLYLEGVLYSGFFLDGLKNGKGKLVNLEENKLLYLGSFLQDEKHGNGVEYFPDGSVYSGEYFKGLKQGKGKLEISGNKRYIGEFFNDKIQGKGTFIFSASKYCQGQWVNNELNGLSIFFKEDKIHKGYFSNNKKNGLGCIYYIKNKSSMISEFKNDMNEGLTLLIDESGNEMMSFFSQGKMNSLPKPIEDTSDSQYLRLKGFFTDVACKLHYESIEETPNYIQE
mmetsp:Transcript_282/g.269  ORF Transcript_282/g.269 Transcript_282/m.269 type:complete len:334 (-) Transcript_282:33-1034(-)